MATRLERAKDDIFQYFSEQPIFSLRPLQRTLRRKRDDWKLPLGLSFTEFLEFLMGEGQLKKVELKSEDYDSKVRYVWGENVSVFELGLSLRPRSYLTHGTAVYLRALNDQIPKAVYVNSEQTEKPRDDGELLQANLDKAFARNQRMSRYVFFHGNTQIVLLSGKNTGQAEVGTVVGPAGESLRATKVERTLIDITVRPAYAGGIVQVMEIYRQARGEVSGNVLVATLRKLDYLYPYHQAIGFLMERAGYEPEIFEKLRSLGLGHDFYLVHGMKEKEYDRGWRLFYPKGL